MYSFVQHCAQDGVQLHFPRGKKEGKKERRQEKEEKVSERGRHKGEREQRWKGAHKNTLAHPINSLPLVFI